MKALIKKVAMVGGVESLGVVVGGIAGLLIVNVLPKESYAFYTFLIACMTLISGVTDMGLVHCTMPIVRERNREVSWVVGVCHQVFRRRWQLLFLGILCVGPYWCYTVLQHGWGTADYLAASALMVAAVMLGMRQSYLHTILVILGEVASLSRVSLWATLLRLACVAAVLAIPFTSHSVAALMAASVLAVVLGLTLMERIFRGDLHLAHRLNDADRRSVDVDILRIAKPLFASSLFYQFQGVITIFVVSLFGTTTLIAEAGAAGRLAMLLVVVDKVAGTLFLPAIARAPATRDLGLVIVKAHLAYLGVIALVVLSSVVFPQYWILLLGKQYATLQPLLWMVFLATLLMNGAQFAFTTMAARGLTTKQVLTVPLILSVQVVYLFLFGVADIKAVLGFNLATCASHFVYQYTLLGWRLHRGTYA